MCKETQSLHIKVLNSRSLELILNSKFCDNNMDSTNIIHNESTYVEYFTMMSDISWLGVLLVS